MFVSLTAIVGVFGGPEFLVQYPNEDIAYYTTIAFRAVVAGGACKPLDGEMSALDYFSQPECRALTMSPSSRVIAEQAFAYAGNPYFRAASWVPEKVL